MSYTQTDRTLALAGVFQATILVKRTAYQGEGETEAVEACLQSIFRLESEDVPGVFGGATSLAPGLRALVEQIGGRTRRDTEVTRYVLSLLHLERKLMGNPRMLGQVREGIDRAAAQLEHFPIGHSNIQASLADLYANTISHLKPRILVNGNALYLQNPDTANRIRALLLAGIRAAVLWRQCGGRRWTLLLSPGRYVRDAGRILHTLEQDPPIEES